MGHDVTVFARDPSRRPERIRDRHLQNTRRFRQAEFDWLLKIGGITVQINAALGGAMTLDNLRPDL